MKELVYRGDGSDQIRNRKWSSTHTCESKLSRIPGIELYSPEDPSRCAAVLSLVMKDIDCGELGYILESAYGILCRMGLHCAPMAHRLGTFPEGTVRLSPGYFTRKEDIDYLYGALEEIAALKS